MSKCPTCHRDKPKTNAQRNQFHRMCRELGLHIGLTPGKVKESVKEDFYGMEEWKIGDRWYRGVKPSEQSERDEYSQLIDHLIQFAAENCEYVFDVERNVQIDREMA